MDDQSGWEQLRCNFFSLVCTKVLGSYFSKLGFCNERSGTSIDGVVFRNKDLFVEVSYIPESAVNYIPTLVFGVLNKKNIEGDKITSLPAWMVIPENVDARRYSFWRFRNAEELEATLNKLSIDVIDMYVRPLFEDRIKLESAIQNFINLRVSTK